MKELLDKIQSIRSSFPALDQEINGNKLVYFDNAATTLKPWPVINAITNHYTKNIANIHRGVHFLSEQGTKSYEETRSTVKHFINADNTDEIIFTKGTTESINLVANSFCDAFLNKDDEIIISKMEHHSNILPWQIVSKHKEIIIKAISITKSGELELSSLNKLITKKTKLISITYSSNTLGTTNDIKKIISIAHKKGIKVLIDAAQAVAHTKIDVQSLDCDFLVFSAHKMYGPEGVGVLYGKKELLNEMPPYQGGGDMIKDVTINKSTYNDLPYKFEAGTPNISGVIAFKKSIEFIEQIGMKNIFAIENELLRYATEKLQKVKDLTIIGTSDIKAPVISFIIKDLHAYDIGNILDMQGIAVRTGHHCTQPIMNYFNIAATVRVSFGMYNTFEEIDKLIVGIKKAKDLL